MAAVADVVAESKRVFLPTDPPGGLNMAAINAAVFQSGVTDEAGCQRLLAALKKQ